MYTTYFNDTNTLTKDEIMEMLDDIIDDKEDKKDE